MIRYESTGPLQDKDFALLEQIQKLIFTADTGLRNLRERLNRQNDVRVHLAWDEEKLIGFKIGYQQTSDTFYSWLGGVLPSHRHQGIGLELMQRQHTDAKELGYKKIQTKSRNKFPEMIRLNIKCGFRIVGLVYKGEEKDFSIVFEKVLSL